MFDGFARHFVMSISMECLFGFNMPSQG